MTDRNTNAHFELAPQVAIERSTFPYNCNVHTSFNVGDLIPFYCIEVLPGDSFKIETSKVARLQTLIAPVMDNLYLDTYYFFVPNRLVWDHWQAFCGENNATYWTQLTEYAVPQIDMPEEGWDSGTIADYFGIPTMISNPGEYEGRIKVNALPFRAYCKIWNDWFRDENLQDPLYFPMGDAMVGGNQLTPYKGGVPAKANKYHDYFTSCLPAPQKGPDVSFVDGIVPIYTHLMDIVNPNGKEPLHLGTHNNQNLSTNRSVSAYFNGGKIGYLNTNDADSSSPGTTKLVPTNLYGSLGDLKEYVNGEFVRSLDFTINSLRQAFQVQRLYEKDARGGTRYIEILKTHFGVTSPDSRLQRAEYLGGNRVPLNIEQVINTTSGANGLLPGDASGWSQTNDTHFDVDKSFVEHGYLIGLMVARYDHTYQQGLERMWSRHHRFDFYWPALAHLGEKAVYVDEIYLDSDNGEYDVFGYQEAWAEYRYKPNYVTGNMRSNMNNSLDIWHFADYYDKKPTLSYAWIEEDQNNIDRCLTVSSNVDNQIFADVFIKNTATRPLPLYSIPGLIDHF